jgi:hypothetical protein
VAFAAGGGEVRAAASAKVIDTTKARVYERSKVAKRNAL